MVGRTADTPFTAAIADYVQRVQHYTSFEIEIVPELKNRRKLSEEQQRISEGEQILKSVNAADTVVLLDERGKEFRSVEFAAWLQRKQSATGKRLFFVIGGPYGFSPAVYERADEKIALSKMTFSHQMVRLVFVEQLYRALNILSGGAYHHE